MRYTFDHDYHIHSRLSTCSRVEAQNKERILKYALDNGLKRICVTDHFWDRTVPGAIDWYKPQDFEWISQILPLPQAENVEFMFGAETEMTKDFVVGMERATYDKLDFIIIPTTHLNNKGFGLSEKDAESVEGRAKVWLEKFDALLHMDIPYHKVGAAHLACGLIAPGKRNDYLAILDMLPEKELTTLFTRAADVGIGIELNSSDMNFKDEEAKTVLRMFEIAKKCGCKFYMGSDAHSPADLDRAKAIFERAIDYLELKETDKFYIEK
ncbi:MAG: hypothetical protein E7633_01840 [Ruminococcaceae bacterium]|nr:hypothetical protein [Oscillospiraceae bacterium]